MKPTIALAVTLACFAQPAMADDHKANDNMAKESYKQAPEVFRTWVNARAGTGKPVHWIAEGGVYAYPSGEKLFGLIGFDSSTVQWPDKPGDIVYHFTRKTFAYTDKDTGEVLKSYNGNKVEPIAYPYQMITYRFENGRIYGDVEQGEGDRVRQIKSKDGMPYRKLGNSYVYNASVFSIFLCHPVISIRRGRIMISFFILRVA